VDAPRDPNDAPAGGTWVRRTAWLLGGVAAALYVYAMFMVVAEANA
jgi:hypothetical protein